MSAEHYIPFRLEDLLHRLHTGDTPDHIAISRRLERIFGLEALERLTELKRLYAAFDPNCDTRTISGEKTGDTAALIAGLRALVERANYSELSEAEFQQALRTESVFDVKLHTPLDDYAERILFTRGRRRRKETVRRWFGLVQREIDVEYFERVLLYVRYKDAAHFAAQKKKRPALAFIPGSSQLKLFANVPVADIEMLLPNSEVRMRPLDQAIIAIPALIGALGLIGKVVASATLLYALARYWIGLHHEAPEVNGAVWAGIGAVGFTLFLFINRQLARYRYKKIQFLKALSDNLYFRNLDNNSGVLHRVLDDAREEEIKEAALAYHFLAEAPGSAAELDKRVEHWFATQLDCRLDFEVDDALAKLERLGLAWREGEHWHALSPRAASERLEKLWLGSF